MGDLLMFQPMMLHRGLENTSEKIRLSADIRYQLKGTPTIWRARYTLTYSKNFESEMRKTVNERGLELGVALRVIDQLYVEGPDSRDLRTRAMTAARAFSENR